jgi:hypothetical protein
MGSNVQTHERENIFILTNWNDLNCIIMVIESKGTGCMVHVARTWEKRNAYNTTSRKHTSWKIPALVGKVILKWIKRNSAWAR